jgi:hypothetical protein
MMLKGKGHFHPPNKQDYTKSNTDGNYVKKIWKLRQLFMCHFPMFPTFTQNYQTNRSTSNSYYHFFMLTV